MQADKIEIVQMVNDQMFTTVIDVSVLIPVMEVRGATVTGTFDPPYEVNPIIRGLPRFSTFAGPMVGARNRARYEDVAAYAALST